MRETAKTGRKVPMVVSAYPELSEALAIERDRQLNIWRNAGGQEPHHVLISEATGLPWNRWTFGHAFRKIATEAGLPMQTQFRYLRATAQTELAD